eukprot:TRINITY_DN1248_c1_g1_i1.p1 TRINITY_DN1248_c1_g1~~TRINITY_DN1248_c1_g1_i1.p1  ORF type:complete len:417 (+),score=99.50 TRINITY_DN1248_c1_g1_i1:65-1252(+)
MKSSEPLRDTDTRTDVWWRDERETLLSLTQSPAYVIHRASIEKRVKAISQMKSLSRFFYAIKANAEPEILKIVYKYGGGFETVSPSEVLFVKKLFPDIDCSKRILFTPNFVPKREYEFGFKENVIVTVDSLYPLENWPEVFKGKSILLRVDTGKGKGHHEHVKTAGKLSKFGIPIEEMAEARKLVTLCRATVVGLHAHAGSGLLDPTHWEGIANKCDQLRELFPEIRSFDVGGGLGVVQDPRVGSPDKELDLVEMDEYLLKYKAAHPDIELWIEPGRFVIAESCVLLAKVTQIKRKGDNCFVGIESGFNSLLRPILYQSYHHIVNLTQYNLADQEMMKCSIVGMICETGDIFGKDRVLPVNTAEDDVILIDTAGAYGHSMSNNYNMREPAPQIVI